MTAHLHLWIMDPSTAKLRCAVCSTETAIPQEEARKIREFELAFKQGKKGGLKVSVDTAVAVAEAPAPKKEKVEFVLPEGAIGIKEAAELLGTDPKSLRRRLRAKGFQKPGTRWYLMPDQMDALATGAAEPKGEVAKDVGEE